MKIKQWLVIGLFGLTGGLAHGAFTPPTDAQLAAAAGDPALVGGLIDGASVTEVAGVLRDAIVRVVALGLPPAERDARIAALIKKIFAALPGQSQALAAALGTAVAEAAGESITPAVVSAIQVATITAAGSEGASAGAAFGNSYRAAAAPPSESGSASKSSALIPPSPPVGKQYEGLDVK